MGYVTQRTSDLSGEIVTNGDLVTVVVKGHPALGGDSKVFDASKKELEALKTVTGLVELEMRDSYGNSSTTFATAAELAKLVPEDKLKGFDNAKGRRTGYRVGANGQ